MAPMRGLSRAIVCVAATIIAIRFALHQRSVGESTTEPAKPTVRARGIKGRSELDAVLSEWSDIYGASPPSDSRLLAHYMTTPPEAPPVKLRRKAGYDAGSAFKRWALRRGKGE